jgi:hypothetical protein
MIGLLHAEVNEQMIIRSKRSRMAKPDLIRLNVEISRELWRRAKIRAAETEKDLREIVIEALENYLGAKSKRGGGRNG